MRSKMACDCSSDPPLTPSGGGAPSPTLAPCGSSHLAPLPPLLRLAVSGGLRRSWGMSSISCIRPHTNSVRSCLGGGPPPWFVGLSPPSPACCELSVLAVCGVPPLHPLVQGGSQPLFPAWRVWGTHAAVQGGSPVPPRGCKLGYCAALLGCPPLSHARVFHALRFRGVYLLFFFLATRWSSAWPLRGVSLAPLPAHGLCTLLGWGSPNRLPLVAAR